MAFDIVEDITIDDLVEELNSRNLPVCYRAAFVINALRGKKAVIPAPVVEVPAPASADVTPAPVTITAALNEQQP